MSEESPFERTTAMAIVSEPEESVSMQDMADLGFIMPIATPKKLRALFEQKQLLYAAILDESDYIYTVAYQENGRTQQRIYTRLKDAEKAASTVNAEARAMPKKSGIVKLAAALGITARRKVTGGLPTEAGATYSYVIYEAMHLRTGRSEEGVGWCDIKERKGNISAHDMIATADTRAYNRAVLRLAGFGDVSADEIVSGALTEGSAIDVADEPSVLKKPAALPPPQSDELVAAQRAWAAELSKREAGVLPFAQQSSAHARTLRAKAARGSASAAQQMGVAGFSWEGQGQDSLSHEMFDVGAPAVTPEQFSNIKAAAAASMPSEQTIRNGSGWDLSGTGSSLEENRAEVAKPVTRPQAAAQVPAASVPTAQTISDGSGEVITGASAKVLSQKLLKGLGTREAAQAWLRVHAGVESSSFVRQSQYEKLMKIEVVAVAAKKES
jgi:hypothetical protein